MSKSKTMFFRGTKITASTVAGKGGPTSIVLMLGALVVLGLAIRTTIQGAAGTWVEFDVNTILDWVVVGAVVCVVLWFLSEVTGLRTEVAVRWYALTERSERAALAEAWRAQQERRVAQAEAERIERERAAAQTIWDAHVAELEDARVAEQQAWVAAQAVERVECERVEQSEQDVAPVLDLDREREERRSA